MLFELKPGEEIPKELGALVAANSAWWIRPKKAPEPKKKCR